jgi:hypothetical protein
MNLCMWPMGDGYYCPLEEDHPGNCVESDNPAAVEGSVEEVYEKIYGGVTYEGEPL